MIVRIEYARIPVVQASSRVKQNPGPGPSLKANEDRDQILVEKTFLVLLWRGRGGYEGRGDVLRWPVASRMVSSQDTRLKKRLTLSGRVQRNESCSQLIFSRRLAMIAVKVWTSQGSPFPNSSASTSDGPGLSVKRSPTSRPHSSKSSSRACCRGDIPCSTNPVTQCHSPLSCRTLRLLLNKAIEP
jgi:hypothetical protein